MSAAVLIPYRDLKAKGVPYFEAASLALERAGKFPKRVPIGPQPVRLRRIRNSWSKSAKCCPGAFLWVKLSMRIGTKRPVIIGEVVVFRS